MHKLIILITVPPDDDLFDLHWPEFLRVAESMPGLVRETTSRVDFRLYGDVDVRMIHELHFASLRALEAAMQSEAGRNAGAILQRITGGQVTLLFADHHEDELENLKGLPRPPWKTPDDLAAFIEARGITAEFVRPDAGTPTVEAAARAVGTTPDRIIKSVLFLIHDRPVLAIAGGLEPIDRRALAARYEVGRKQVKLAGPDDVLRITGFPVGGVPPFGFPEPVETLIDPAVLAQPEVYGGGGDHHTLIRLSPEEIRRVTAAEAVPLGGE